MRVDLILTGSDNQPPPWNLGRVWPAGNQPHQVAAAVVARELGADFLLFWDTTLGEPDEAVVQSVALMPGDVWHAGLALGMAGLPQMIDYVDPVWRFNRDPEAGIVATSWRVSLRACLARSVVVDRLGGPNAHFTTLAAASLELGHRWIWGGALMRAVSQLVPRPLWIKEWPPLPVVDELRFLRMRFGRMWAAWACLRHWRRGGDLLEIVQAWRRAQPEDVVITQQPVHSPFDEDESRLGGEMAVSVLIPTLDRYPHLFNLLLQLRQQTLPPMEIVVVDQTGIDERDTTWPERYPDLPLRVIWRETAGQCSSRNAGLRQIRGDAVLFLDDDDEIPPDLVARHVAFLRRFDCDASCGVAEEVGAGALPASFTRIRDSEVFPTNNTLLRTAALRKSGLFDLAYEKGERADHDLGMRLYLSGASLVLNPSASVVHLRAPRGGLRQHKARVVTRASSRASLTRGHFLAPTEGYLWSRFFSERQVREALFIRTLGTLRGTHTGARRVLRVLLMTIQMPDTWRKNIANLSTGRKKLVDYPEIPDFMQASAEEKATK